MMDEIEIEKYFKYVQKHKNWKKPRIRSGGNSLWHPFYAKHMDSYKKHMDTYAKNG